MLSRNNADRHDLSGVGSPGERPGVDLAERQRVGVLALAISHVQRTVEGTGIVDFVPKPVEAQIAEGPVPTQTAIAAAQALLAEPRQEFPQQLQQEN